MQRVLTDSGLSTKFGQKKCSCFSRPNWYADLSSTISAWSNSGCRVVCRLIPMTCAHMQVVGQTLRTKQNIGHGSVSSVSNQCECLKLSSGLVTLVCCVRERRMRYRLYFKYFHHVQAVSSQVVVVNLFTALTSSSKVHEESQFPVLNTHVYPLTIQPTIRVKQDCFTQLWYRVYTF